MISIKEILNTIVEIRRKHTAPPTGSEVVVRGIDEITAADALLLDLQERILDSDGGRVKIKTEEILGRELKPGDLFSMRGSGHWDLAMEFGSIGEMVYIRTNISADRAPDPDQKIYRITIEAAG